MNEQRAIDNSLGTSPNNSLNSSLIMMQIQALREALQRLVDQDDYTEMALLGNELKEVQSKPDY